MFVRALAQVFIGVTVCFGAGGFEGQWVFYVLARILLEMMSVGLVQMSGGNVSGAYRGLLAGWQLIWVVRENPEL